MNTLASIEAGYFLWVTFLELLKGNPGTDIQNEKTKRPEIASGMGNKVSLQ